MSEQKHTCTPGLIGSAYGCDACGLRDPERHTAVPDLMAALEESLAVAKSKFACALCGRSPAAGNANVTEGDTVRWLCHDTARRSCYVRWTVYGERSTPDVLVADPDHTT